MEYDICKVKRFCGGFYFSLDNVDKLVFRSLVPFQFCEMWDVSPVCEIITIVMVIFPFGPVSAAKPAKFPQCRG